MLKKILSSFVVIVMSIVGMSGLFVNARHSSSNQRLSPQYINLNFHATLQDDNSVHMTWARFNVPSGHKFKYRKVMWSNTNSNPIYKQDKYIKYNGDLGFTWYTYKGTPAGTNYFRVCAVTHASDGYHRYCSKNVDRINLGETYKENKTYEKKDYKKEKVVVNKQKNYQLSESNRKMIDGLVDRFQERLGEKFETSSDQLDYIDDVLDLVESNINKYSGKTQVMFKYLFEKLGDLRAIIELSSVLDLD